MRAPSIVRSLHFLAALLPLAASCDVQERAKPRTLVVISIDTLRPERLGVYGNSPDVSPVLDALARESIVFEHALTTAPWTLPSHMSMLTGLDPVAHGVRCANDVLAPSITTLAESLRAHGYSTSAFTDGGFVSRAYGFDHGFDVYEEPATTQAPRGFAHSIPRAMNWLDDHAREDAFLFLHTFDVHAPYATGDAETLERFRSRPTPDGDDDHRLEEARYLYAQRIADVPRYGRMSELLNDYDAGVHEADRGVGMLLEHLKRSGRYDDALIVVLSDHGESFFDHDVYVGHGLFLTDDELHIPLIVKLPRAESAGLRVPGLVDVLDLYPTVLAVAAVSPPPGLPGESWLGIARGTPRTRTTSFAESFNTDRYALTTSSHKYISPSPHWPMSIALHHLGPETPPMLDGRRPGKEYTIGAAKTVLSYAKRTEPLGLRDRIPVGARLYDRESDPTEEADLAERDAAQRERMEAQLEQQWHASATVRAARGVSLGSAANSPEHLEHLHALGYVVSDDAATPRKLDLDAALGATFRPSGVDMTPLVNADRAVHKLRLAEDKPFGESQLQSARAAATTYAAWGLANKEFQARAQWRLRALQELCERRGSPLDPKLWADFQAWLDSQPKDDDESD